MSATEPLEAELRRIRPATVWTPLGPRLVLESRVTTADSESVSLIVILAGRHAIELHARADTFDPRLAAFLVDHAAALDPAVFDAATVTASAATFPPPFTFDKVVVAPPQVAQRYAQQSRYLASLLTLVFPAYTGELPDGCSRRHYMHQLYGRDVRPVPFARWDRRRGARG